MPRHQRPTPTGQDWPARVNRLEAEIAGLKRAMRSRGLIEQAKGILAERLGCDPETAFAHLSRASQEANISLVDLAADLVGATIADRADAEDPEANPPLPAPAAPGAERGSQPPLRIAGGLGDGTVALPADLARLLRRSVAALDAASDLREVAEAIVAVAMQDAPGAAAAVFATEDDGAVRLLTSHGWAAQVASEWQRVPASVNTTIATAVRTARPVLLDGDEPHDFVLVGPGGRRAVFPILSGERAVGALSLVWPEPKEVTADERAFLDRLSVAAGRAIRVRWPAELPALAPAPARDTWVATMLETLYAQGHLLSPVVDDAGTIVDFVIEATTAETRRTDGETTGRRLLDVYPMLADHGVFAAYAGLLGDGGGYERRAGVEEAIIDGLPRRVIVHRRAARVGEAIIATWERIDEAVSLDERIDRLEALARSGSAEWDLRAGDATWSPGLYRLLGRDPSRPPLRLEKFTDLFPTEDRRRLRLLLREITAGRSATADVLLSGDAEPIPVRVFGEAETDADGTPRLIRLIIQDITEQHAAEEKWLRSERMLAARQLRLAQEQSVTQALAELLYPGDDLDVRVAGYAVAGRHHAIPGTPAMRGDFCDAVPLPDGLLTALGDMFGVGIAAAASVIRLRYPAVALGTAGSPPDSILQLLNAQLLADASAPMASLIMTRLSGSTLEWSSAGHLPPLLVRDGKATILDDAPGPALGLARNPTYATSKVELRPGDVFVCYTNGMIDHAVASPLAELAERVGAAVAAGDVQAVLDLVPPTATDEACVLTLRAE